MSATAAVSVTSKIRLAGSIPLERQLPPHLVREARIAHRLAGEVDLQRQLATLRVVGGDQPDGLLGDPAVDAADQPEALRGREECARLDQAAAVVPHAQEDLVLGRLAGLQVDDRLAGEHEEAPLGRLADALGPGAPLVHLAAARSGRTRTTRSRPVSFAVDIAVSASASSSAPITVPLVEGGDAGAHRDPDPLAVDDEGMPPGDAEQLVRDGSSPWSGRCRGGGCRRRRRRPERVRRSCGAGH